jgi:hypothetical protein
MPKEVPTTADAIDPVEGTMSGDTDTGTGAFAEKCTPETAP